jgi:hypothetical protein
MRTQTCFALTSNMPSTSQGDATLLTEHNRVVRSTQNSGDEHITD